jgi:hypothetical protein
MRFPFGLFASSSASVRLASFRRRFLRDFEQVAENLGSMLWRIPLW